MSGLENQVVLITGCSSGIGRALAREFAAGGHRVVATARRLESIEDLVGDSVQILELDVTDEATIASAVRAANDAVGAIDIVVNNADSIEARARISETNSSSAEVVASAIVEAATAADPPSLLRVGTGSRFLPALGRLPTGIRDRFFSKRFGLDRITK